MQAKILSIFAALVLVAGCMEQGEPYAPGSLNRLTVKVAYPDGVSMRGGATVSIVEVSGITAYSVKTGAEGSAVTEVPNGIYRITARDRDEDIVFNASRDKVLISNEDINLEMELKQSKAGALVIKEIYSGGCSKAPKEGTYQSDKYIIIHNNSVDTEYLDGLCMGTLSPYNSTGANPWISGGKLPEFLPVIQAVLAIPGTGTDFPLEPGEDAVIALCGAIDHTAEYPLSVNLDLPGVFALYDPVLFPNATYHPAPGGNVLASRYLEIIIKTGQANAYTLSVNSPTFVLFRAPSGTDIRAYVQLPENQPQVPGSNEKVVAVPQDWVMDGVEVFFGGSTGNQKRLPETIDAGAASLSETFKGRTLMRKADDALSTAYGFEMLQDTNNSTEDFYERETQSLHR
ncbi:MAG: DUF4876 domain-containing protein [Bacteroidales bacterium]|nr:DUF4876 domain-containing protein [Bacteroidales bacterium]